MNRSSNRVWASLALLSIIAPVGLLATFRLTGVLSEPSKPEVITVETGMWSMSRPTRTLNILEVVRNSYAISAISIDFDITIGRYDEQHLSYSSTDILWLRTTANASLNDGLVHTITIRFSDIDAYSFLDADEDPDETTRIYNLIIHRVIDPGSYGRDAYIMADGLPEAKQCVLDTWARWIFTDENDQHHGMRVVLEVVYQQGGAYKQVNLPVSLRVIAR